MKRSDRMQHIIEKLATKHGVDLSQPGAHFRLEMPGFDRLCVEVLPGNQVSVAHYFEQNGDLVADPEIVFYVSSMGMGWYATEITQVVGGYKQLVIGIKSNGEFDQFYSSPQADAASFANMWGRNISHQGWLTNGVRTA